MIRLSASKIKTFSNCGLLGYFKYVCNLPDRGNLGSDLGGITHTILECLLEKKRTNHVQFSLDSRDPYIVPGIERLTKKLLKKKDILNEENLAKVKGFLLTALENDFFGEKTLDVRTEYEFNYKTDKYLCNGFLDKVLIYPDKIKIVDYKSSKKKFTGEDISFNIQGLLYSLIMSKEYPDIPIEVEFLFLAFPKSPSIKMSFTKKQLDGFESYLDYIADYLTDYGLEKALTNAAADGGPGKNWLCGKEKFMTKADGSPVFVCEQKFPYIYWQAVKDGHKPISAFSKKQLEKYELEGYKIETKRHEGCPKFN